MDDGAFGRGLVEQRKFLIAWGQKRYRLARHDAEDLVQETLIKAWAARESYIEQASFRSWLMVIMVHIFLSMKRRAWRMTYTDDPVVLERASQSGGQFETTYLHEVMAAMGDISPEKAVSIIRIVLGDQYDEAARKLKVADGTVKSRVARGRRELRAALKDDMGLHSQQEEEAEP